jgi:uncharacterized protein GlcG (DUF336 family)
MDGAALLSMPVAYDKAYTAVHADARVARHQGRPAAARRRNHPASIAWWSSS